jgi:hypothetical protein
MKRRADEMVHGPRLASTVRSPSLRSIGDQTQRPLSKSPTISHTQVARAINAAVPKVVSSGSPTSRT